MFTLAISFLTAVSPPLSSSNRTSSLLLCGTDTCKFDEEHFRRVALQYLPRANMRSYRAAPGLTADLKESHNNQYFAESSTLEIRS